MPPENRRRRRPRQTEPDNAGWSPEEQAKHALDKKLKTPLAELPLSVRAVNTLEEHDVILVGELIRLTYDDLIKIKNFGDTTLTEVRQVVEAFGIPLPQWDKPDRPPVVRQKAKDLFQW